MSKVNLANINNALLQVKSKFCLFVFLSHDNNSSLAKEIDNIIEGIEKLGIQWSDNPKPYLNTKDPAKFFIQGVLQQMQISLHRKELSWPTPPPLPFFFW